MKILIDLDDTLVNTTTLNNDAYNYALEKFGLNRIIQSDRITRNSLKINDDALLKFITQEKQRYFTSNWLKYRIVLNNLLIDKIKKHTNVDYFLWTKSNKTRAMETLDKCNLSKYFKDIIFDDKLNMESSISKFQTLFSDKGILIYENNHKFFESHAIQVVDKIKNQFFDVKGYQISLLDT